MWSLSEFVAAYESYDGDNLDGFIAHWAKALGVEA